MQSQPSFFRPIYLLHAEGLCVLAASCGAFQLLFPHHWLVFACLFLVPDLSLLPYVRGANAFASVVYNSAHSYVLPAIVGMLAVYYSRSLLGEIGLIWVAHIAMDRALGYGLKYPASFQFTHIQSTANPASLG